MTLLLRVIPYCVEYQDLSTKMDSFEKKIFS